MSKEKAREFLARLKALKEELGVEIGDEHYEDEFMRLDIGEESYHVYDDDELLCDHEERMTRNLQADIAADPLAYVAVGEFVTSPNDFQPPVDLRIELLDDKMRKWLRDWTARHINDDRMHGIITNITDE